MGHRLDSRVEVGFSHILGCSSEKIEIEKGAPLWLSHA